MDCATKGSSCRLITSTPGGAPARDRWRLRRPACACRRRPGAEPLAWLSSQCLFSRSVYLSPYKMHLVALHGWWKTALGSASRMLTRSAEPQVKLHWRCCGGLGLVAVNAHVD